jgi:3-methyladenine DNA glycosylase AlkD
VGEARMDAMVEDIGSWDLCDQCCNNLFRSTDFAWKKALEWSGGQGEFRKRAGFVLMATLAVHDRRANDDDFVPFLESVEEQSDDDRTYVKKAVNWALRQIGKRDLPLNLKAIDVAERLMSKGDRSSRWIASDALRELRSDAVQQRLKNREVRC